MTVTARIGASRRLALNRGHARDRVRNHALVHTLRVAVSSRLLTVSGARRSSWRASVPHAHVQARDALPPARCPRCESKRTLLAYEVGGKLCHVCHACYYVWDVEKTP